MQGKNSPPLSGVSRTTIEGYVMYCRNAPPPEAATSPVDAAVLG